MRLTTQQNTVHRAAQVEKFRLFDYRGDAQERLEKIAAAEQRPVELTRLERKFGVKIIGIKAKYQVNGYYRCILAATDGSEVYADLTPDIVNLLESGKVEIKEIPTGSAYIRRKWFWKDGEWRGVVVEELDRSVNCGCGEKNCRHIQAVVEAEKAKIKIPEKPQDESKTSPEGNTTQEVISMQPEPFDCVSGAMGDWKDGGFPTPLEPGFQKAAEYEKQRAEETFCVICGRKLTNPTSVAIEIGPECRQKVAAEQYLVEFKDALQVSVAVKEAAKLYHETEYQKMVIRAVMVCNAPLPVKVLRSPMNRREQYWGYKRNPILYYLDEKERLNFIDMYRRKPRHRFASDDNYQTELDSIALAEVRKGKENDCQRRRLA